MHGMRTRVDLSDVRLSVLSAQLSGVRLFFLIKIQCAQSEFDARPPHFPWGDREKKNKKLGNGGISPPPLPPCPARRGRKNLMYSGAQRPGVLTSRASLRCCDTDRVHCRPPLRWPNSLQRLACWDPKFGGAPRVGEPTCNPGCCAHSLP